MVKADRYTEDGCEAITKAREADVEDRIYQIGEISQKTGLQKTAEGWVTPKGIGAKYEVTEMASGKIYDTPDKNFRIIERNHNGKKTYDIRNRKDSQSEDIKDIKSLEEAKSIVEKKQKVAEGTKKNSLENAKKNEDSAPRQLTGDCKITIKG